MAAHDAIVVGAGVVGASTAAALTAAGLSVAIVTGGEDRIAVSATSASGGLVRCYEPEPYRRALALRSHELLWGRPGGRRDLTGHRTTGSLVCLTEAEAEKAEAALAELTDSGVRAELLGPREIGGRWPSLGTAGIVAAMWEPAGGYADPRRTAALLLTEAGQRGATVLEGPALGVLTSADGTTVTGVRTGHGRLAAAAVVLAAGCGTPQLLPPHVRPALRTRRVRYALVGWPDASVPAVMDNVTGMWGRPWGADSLLVGRPVDEWDVAPGFGTDITPEQLAFVRQGGRSRWPRLVDAPLRGARWGTDLYAAEPLVGAADGCRGLVLATGWSGGGFKTAPAAGEAACAAVLQSLDG